MALTINTNVMSITAQRHVSGTNRGLATAMERLSSGMRINSAKDDAAGLAIAERMTAQIRGLTVGVRNGADGISLAQTAEGALGTMTEALQRMRELAVQSVNASNSSTDRTSLDTEFQALNTEVNNIASRVTFNGLSILAGGAGTQDFQIGANVGDTISVTTTDRSAVAPNGDITSVANANTAIGAIDGVLDTLNGDRAALGAAMSQIENALSAQEATLSNTTAARGRIMDADFAAETASMTRNQILQQAGISMIAQANMAPQNVLALLK